jgi:hypothetical protein
VERVELRGSSGTFQVLAGGDDSVRATVTVRGDFSKPGSIFSRPRGADVTKAELKTRTSDRSISFELETGAGRRIEEWRVEVPSRLAAHVFAGNGELEIQGLAGGVVAHANAGRSGRPGRIEVSVRSGSVEARLGVGTVTVSTASSDLGDVRLSSGVGHTQLWIDGQRLERRDPPGSGSEVALTGRGADQIRAKVSVGDAVVRIR